MNKRALLLGGTGAIGIYLAPALTERGYDVTITSRNMRQSDNPSVQYIICNARNDIDALERILATGWDAVVDFMIYSTNEFRIKFTNMLANTEHYIYLSSYRVYADSQSIAIREDFPRLLETSEDMGFLATDEYALAKARQEDILRGSGWLNWTVVRPAITYSINRFQLVTLEADMIINRSLRKRPVIVPEPALSHKTTMTWAGDAARMMAALINEPSAFGGIYNICTSEYRTWGEVAGYYHEILGLEIVPVTIEDYLMITGTKALYQLRYDRLLDRVMDNKKILSFSNIEHNSLMLLRDGLVHELSKLYSLGYDLTGNQQMNKAMDMYLYANHFT